MDKLWSTICRWWPSAILQRLRQVCGVTQEDLQDMLVELRALNPKPGHAFGSDPVSPVVPDVFVRPLTGWHMDC